MYTSTSKRVPTQKITARDAVKFSDLEIEKPGFWQIRRQSLIYAAAGDKAGAIRLAKESMAGAKAAGNQNYVKQNMDSLKEWGAL